MTRQIVLGDQPVVPYKKQLSQLPTRKKITVAGCCVFFGGIVAIPTFGFFIGADKDISIVDAMGEASATEWFKALGFSLIVLGGNATQFMPDFIKLVDQPLTRFSQYKSARLQSGFYKTEIKSSSNEKKLVVHIPSDRRTCSGTARFAVDMVGTSILAVAGGLTIGDLYSASLSGAEKYIILFSMFTAASSFVRELSFDATHWAVNAVTGVGESSWRDLLPSGWAGWLGLPIKLIFTVVYYNVFGDSLYGAVASSIKSLPDDELDFSAKNVMLYGLFSIIMSVRFSQLTYSAFPQLWRQFKSMWQQPGLKKILYFFVVNPLAFLSTASFFFSLRADMNAGNYDYLGEKIANHFDYIAATVGGISNMAAYASMFTDWIFPLPGDGVVVSQSSTRVGIGNGTATRDTEGGTGPFAETNPLMGKGGTGSIPSYCSTSNGKGKKGPEQKEGGDSPSRQGGMFPSPQNGCCERVKRVVLSCLGYGRRG